MLISPDEVKAKAKSKENENYAFRTYLKMHADPLKLDGFEVVSGPRTTGDGYYESCVVAIEGNQIEITE